MLEQGPSLYHREVLRLLYEYLRLQEPKAPKMHALINSITAVVHRHLKGPLWREAVDLLKLAVSNSAALVQPPTRGLPVVDLGLFNQTLPGPTLQFSMDLKVRAPAEHWQWLCVLAQGKGHPVCTCTRAHCHAHACLYSCACAHTRGMSEHTVKHLYTCRMCW